eukprot:CAMPEP_0172036028 /NCGR_PEP_ID=MMETSP1041-20130122/21929_1 /TAXON_ID=464988 /ORGANISM="Hemiselmis andersenii, Strain CCMP439" /LENGTH=51 /DNA_ID=CAMNT_0012693197 /DNA_START=45 /DNA_END=196 /DNA_ORIENTATION=-
MTTSTSATTHFIWALQLGQEGRCCPAWAVRRWEGASLGAGGAQAVASTPSA